uniref:SRCR domain-containing protein n=1 Tax=Neogobius melanostomus TaxID=47308 RepID=A0A8C6WMN9_9GOBI
MDCNRTRTGPETCPTLNVTCKGKGAGPGWGLERGGAHLCLCPEPLRLVGGASRCEGTVEAELRGEWRRVATYGSWDLEAAYLILDSVRLVGGRSLCSGSLQIQDQSLAQSWAGVCEGALDRRGAEVLCRELGCGAPLLQGALSPLGQTFHCEGNESKLMDCNRTRTGPETCPTLNLTCKEPLRLVGGASRCEGTVEAELRGQWRRVVTYGSWDLEAAAAVCRGLDCGSPVSTEKRDGSHRSKVWWVRTACVKKSSVRDCLYDRGYSSNNNNTKHNNDTVSLKTQDTTTVFTHLFSPQEDLNNTIFI